MRCEGAFSVGPVLGLRRLMKRNHEAVRKFLRQGTLGAMILLPLSACGHSAVAPAAPSPVVVPAVPMRVLHLSGVATDDDGHPVPQVTVKVYTSVTNFAYGSVLSTSTDSLGIYSIDFLSTPGVAVTTDKSGYESDEHDGVVFTNDIGVQNLHVYRILQLTAGDSVTVTVLPNDPQCGFDDEWICRTVRVASPASGATVAATTDGLATSALEVLTPNNFCCVPLQQVSLPGGVDAIIQIVMPWTTTVAQTYEITTSAHP